MVGQEKPNPRLDEERAHLEIATFLLSKSDFLSELFSEIFSVRRVH